MIDFAYERAQREMEQESRAYYDEVAALPTLTRLAWDSHAKARYWYYSDHRVAHEALVVWLRERTS